MVQSNGTGEGSHIQYDKFDIINVLCSNTEFQCGFEIPTPFPYSGNLYIFPTVGVVH